MDALKSGNDALLEAAADSTYPCDFVGINIEEVLASAQLVHYMEHTSNVCQVCAGSGTVHHYQGSLYWWHKCLACGGSGRVAVDSRSDND